MLLQRLSSANKSFGEIALWHEISDICHKIMTKKSKCNILKHLNLLLLNQHDDFSLQDSSSVVWLYRIYAFHCYNIHPKSAGRLQTTHNSRSALLLGVALHTFSSPPPVCLVCNIHLKIKHTHTHTHAYALDARCPPPAPGVVRSVCVSSAKVCVCPGMK